MTCPMEANKDERNKANLDLQLLWAYDKDGRMSKGKAPETHHDSVGLTKISSSPHLIFPIFPFPPVYGDSASSFSVLITLHNVLFSLILQTSTGNPQCIYQGLIALHINDVIMNLEDGVPLGLGCPEAQIYEEGCRR